MKNCYFALLYLVVANTYAQQVAYFDPELLQHFIGDGQGIDLSYLERDLDAAPGIYKVSVYVNKSSESALTLEFRENDGKLLPVLNRKQLQELGVDVESHSEFADLLPEAELFPLTAYIPQATQSFDVALQRLDISIPQIYQKRSAVSYDVVSSDKWDNGIPAVMLGYNLSGAHYDYKHGGGNNSNLYLGLNGQINYGPWRLYTQGNFSFSRTEFDGKSLSEDKWDLWNTYLQRDLFSIRSKARFGEINTAGDIFDSFSMRGVSLLTNEEMLHVAERSFMPNISGVANSFAQVLIRQNGRIVYQMNVAPGPWRLDNLPAFGSDGDLEVIVREADGSEHVEFYPYSSVPLMLREGQWRYNVNIGQYYNRNTDTETPFFAMGTVSYGLPHDVTLYGGALVSDDYRSAVLGSAFSLGVLGAVSLDMIHANTRFDDNYDSKEYNGTAYRARYQKTLISTGTAINFASYQYRSGDYWTFQEVNEHGLKTSNWHVGREKERLQFTLSQSFNKWGTLLASGSRTTYRGETPDTKTWQLGYNVNVRDCNLNINYSRLYSKVNEEWRPEERIMFNLDIPLSIFSSHSVTSQSNVTASYQGHMRKDKEGNSHYEQNASLRGWNSESGVNWQIDQTLGNKEERTTTAMIGYSGDQIDGSISLTRMHDMNTYQMAMRGSLLFHEGGLTASARAYDSVALVDVDGLEGVKVSRGLGAHTDSKGYAVLTTLRNYSQNEIAIDPASLPEGAMLLDGTNKNIYPTAGSVIRVKFPARLGKQAIFQMLRLDGRPLPFGTQVKLLDESGKEDVVVNGIVGDDGSLYLSALPMEANLVAVWNEDGQEQRAEYHYVLPQQETVKGDDFVEIPEMVLFPLENNKD